MNEMITESDSLLTKSQLLALVQSGNSLTSQLELKQVLHSMLEIACDLSGSTAGSVILHDHRYDDLYFAAAIGPAEEDLSSIRIPPEHGKAGRVFTTREPIIENDLASEKDHYKTIDNQTHFVTKSMVCVPLLHLDECFGVVQILNKGGGAEQYDEQDLELLQVLAGQSSIAIHNARIFEKLLASSGLYAAPEVRADLLSKMTPEGLPAMREFLTTLFVDMRGFTQLCTVMGNPEKIQQMTSEFLSMLATVVVKHRGIVNKFLGDGLMAIFRGPDASANAVRSAFMMVDGFEKMLYGWNKTTSRSLRFLDIGVGIASDEVILGTVGNEDMHEFTAIGTPVVLAAALERQARSGQRVLCDQLTWQGARHIIQAAEGPTTFTLKKPDQQVPLDFDIFHVRSLRPAEGARRVFVSYVHEEQERVERLLVEPLKNLGFEVFFAAESINLAEDFSDRIGQAIAKCGWFIVAVTERAVASRWVREEVKFALSEDRLEGRVLAVRLDPVDINQLDWRLHRRLYADALGPDSQKALDAIFTVIASDAPGAASGNTE